MEIELKFLVPAASRAALAAEMARGAAAPERRTLAAMYLDTADRRLARAGIAWRLRREGRRWVQALKAGGANPLERFEHEVIRPVGTCDPLEHAGTRVGDRVLVLLERARAEGLEVEVRFRTEVRRTARRIRTRGAVVEVAFDEGRLIAGERTQRIREVEFELVSGSPVAMLALAERWRTRFGLVFDPRSKAARGDRLAQGEPFAPIRKAERPDYPKSADALHAFAAVFDECLAQVTHNAIGLTEGDPSLRVDFVHQLRVGIRRLRSALRSFEGWVPMPPAALVDELRALFRALGRFRDSDVLDSGVVAELTRIGAPLLAMRASEDGADPAEVARSPRTQALLLALIAWRAGLAGSHADAAVADSAGFCRRVERRLSRWHTRIAADWKAFDKLEEHGLHALRKRIKRQRYAVEFFAPVLRRRRVEAYLKPLAVVQERMGELNDLFSARSRYQELLAGDSAAWFALGWLAARIAEVRSLARPELGRLTKTPPPTVRQSAGDSNPTRSGNP